MPPNNIFASSIASQFWCEMQVYSRLKHEEIKKLEKERKKGKGKLWREQQQKQFAQRRYIRTLFGYITKL